MTVRSARRVLVLALAFVLVVSGCGGDSTPSPGGTTLAPTTHTLAPSSSVVKVFDSVPAGCAISRAWGGLAPVPELASCSQPVSSWSSIPAGSVVTTSACGQAVLDTSCGKLYVFQGSSLQVSTCNPPTPVNGTGCLTYGSVGWAETGCSNEVAIATATGSIRLIGTWVSATYVKERKLTLFVVFDGVGEVTPVIDVNANTAGETQTIEAGHFWFTEPGDQPTAVGGVAGREAQPFNALPDVVQELGLESWFGAVLERARADGVDISSVPDMPVVNVRLAGGKLEGSLAREAALIGFDWAGETTRTFPRGDLAVVALVGSDRPRNLLLQERDFNRASALIKDADATGSAVQVIVESTDELATLGKTYVSTLREVGFDPQFFRAADAEEAAAMFNRTVADGSAAIWLSMH